MDDLGNLYVIGLSHRTAAVAVRERYAVQADDRDECVAGLLSSEDIGEACVLSTCNRTEVLVFAEPGKDPTGVVKHRVFRNLEPEHLYVHRGTHAIIHMFRVAGGLDSLVLGESEILAQVKTAFESGRGAGGVGGVLQPLLSQSIQVGKRVQSETSVGQGTLSIARVGVDIAKHVYGSFDSCHALIVGAGETGLLVARHLADQGIAAIDFANRTFTRAEEAAAEFGGSAYGIGDLPGAIEKANLLVVCVDGASELVKREHFSARQIQKHDRPTLVMDLSMPRAVERSVADIENLLCYDLDDLQPVVEKNRRGREDASEEVADLLVAEVHKFLSLRTYALFSPAIAELRRRFESIETEVLDSVVGDTAGAREVQLAHELTKRLLGTALQQMKEGARGARSEEALDRDYQRFLENL
jgi:glutamyl-tRNA reductase